MVPSTPLSHSTLLFCRDLPRSFQYTCYQAIVGTTSSKREREIIVLTDTLFYFLPSILTLQSPMTGARFIFLQRMRDNGHNVKFRTSANVVINEVSRDRRISLVIPRQDAHDSFLLCLSLSYAQFSSLVSSSSPLSSVLLVPAVERSNPLPRCSSHIPAPFTFPFLPGLLSVYLRWSFTKVHYYTTMKRG